LRHIQLYSNDLFLNIRSIISIIGKIISMEIRQLRYFLDIAETEHLTQSAENLFVTQSTLSHGLRQLEQELGVLLFDRLGRGLKLSQAGAEFRGYARRTLREIEAGRTALADLGQLHSGKLTIGAFPTFLNTVVPATLAAFNKEHPRVIIEVRDLRAGPIEDLLVRGDLDMGIAFHPAMHAEVEVEPLFDEQMVLVVSQSHALSRRRNLTLRQLAGVPLALLPRTFATRLLIDSSFRQAGTEPNVSVETESVESLLGVCRYGDLAAIVPDRAARQAKDLKTIYLTEPQMIRHAGILWRRGASRSPAAKKFGAMLLSALR
jgi:LysR family cyn operon transcriptional activator